MFFGEGHHILYSFHTNIALSDHPTLYIYRNSGGNFRVFPKEPKTVLHIFGIAFPQLYSIQVRLLCQYETKEGMVGGMR